MNKEDFDRTITTITTPLPGSTPLAVNYTLTVKKKYEGLNIIDFFSQKIPRSTPLLWMEKIASGNLKVNNKKINQTYTVKAGDLTQHTSAPKIEPEVNNNITLVYADDDILVINKPSPLPVHASGRFVRNTLIAILELAFPTETFKLLHRIDANTTGVVILAKNKFSANHIREQFENKTIKKEYIALVEGILSQDYLNLEHPIGNKVLVGGAREIDKDGKKAKTEITVIERRQEKKQTLLNVIPFTGRTNQIRLHLANMQHPIVGDIGYKDKSYFENNPFTYSADQLFLHAHQLEITHPVSNEKMIFKAQLPEKFQS